MNYTKIIGTGICLPEVYITNDDLINKFKLDTTNEWIVENTNIRQRYICKDGETSTSLGCTAVKQAIENANLKNEDIDMLIVATTSPDKVSPSTACLIKDELKLEKAIAFDIAAVCSGFLFGMSVAEKYISSGMCKNIVVVGVDRFSKITDWNHKHSIFFGDGAGAAVLSQSKTKGFHGFTLYSESENKIGFECEFNETYKMNTKMVYEAAIKTMPIAIEDVLNNENMSIDDIDYLIPHQPSIRILKEVAKRINMPEEKVMMNMDKYANTVSGTIPILLHETWSKLKPGDKILFAAIGSGWTYGAALYEF